MPEPALYARARAICQSQGQSLYVYMHQGQSYMSEPELYARARARARARGTARGIARGTARGTARAAESYFLCIFFYGTYITWSYMPDSLPSKMGQYM